MKNGDVCTTNHFVFAENYFLTSTTCSDSLTHYLAAAQRRQKLNLQIELLTQSSFEKMLEVQISTKSFIILGELVAISQTHERWTNLE